MEQSHSWETDSRPACQEIPQLHGTWRFIIVFTRALHWTTVGRASWNNLKTKDVRFTTFRTALKIHLSVCNHRRWYSNV